MTYAQVPEPLLEWAMLSPDGEPASFILRTNDVQKALNWAKMWSEPLILHRRIVIRRITMVGNWFPHDLVVDVQLATQSAEVEMCWTSEIPMQREEIS